MTVAPNQRLPPIPETNFTAESQQGAPAVAFQNFLGKNFPEIARNQVNYPRDRRKRTVSYVCAVEFYE